MDDNGEMETYIKFITESPGDQFVITELSDDLRYYELFQAIKLKISNKADHRIFLYKLTGLPDGQEPKSIEEIKETIDDLIFVDEEIREIDGRKVKYLEFEIYFIPKYYLTVYFLAEVNSPNKMYSNTIFSFLQRFVNKNKSIFQEKFVYIFDEKELTALRNEENEIIVIITAGRFARFSVLETDANSVLIFTMPENYLSLKKEFLNEKYPQVKDVNTKIELLLKDSYFFG